MMKQKKETGDSVMDHIRNEYHLKSSTGITDLFVQSVVPAEESAVVGVLEIVHGMAEHTDRYLEAAGYLCDRGFAVYMHEHAGHGRSVAKDEDLGYFGEKDGNERLVDDVKSVAQLAKSKHPGKKLVVWGHSMGSFIARRFAAKYPGVADGFIFCGTSGANPAAALGALIADTIGKVKGGHYRSPFINNLAFGSYNKKFNGSTGFEWLSVNEENVRKYVADDKCGYLFTAYGYRDLFRLLGSVSGKDWYEAVPKNLPIYLIAGSMDPVGNYGKGVTEVRDKLVQSGHTDVTMKLYDGLRHEIHNEDCRFDVYADIAAFAEKVVK